MLLTYPPNAICNVPLIVEVLAPKLIPLLKATVTFGPNSNVAPPEGVTVFKPPLIAKVDPAAPVMLAKPAGKLMFPDVPDNCKVRPFKSIVLPELICNTLPDDALTVTSVAFVLSRITSPPVFVTNR